MMSPVTETGHRCRWRAGSIISSTRYAISIAQPAGTAASLAVETSLKFVLNGSDDKALAKFGLTVTPSGLPVDFSMSVTGTSRHDTVQVSVPASTPHA